MTKIIAIKIREITQNMCPLPKSSNIMRVRNSEYICLTRIRMVHNRLKHGCFMSRKQIIMR